MYCNRLYKVHEEDGKPFELEMSWICDESGRKHQRVRGSHSAYVHRCDARTMLAMQRGVHALA